MAASVYPSHQFSQTLRRGDGIPCFAASDILAGAVVRVASSGDWAVQMVASTNEEPLGVAVDNASYGQPVSVYDVSSGNIVRTNTYGNGAGASFPRQAYIGVVGTSTATHPISGVTVTFALLGQVTGAGGTGGSNGPAVGGASAPQWAVGQAFESAATGDFAAYRIAPKQLSGLTI